jgi:hypothetical protein
MASLNQDKHRDKLSALLPDSNSSGVSLEISTPTSEKLFYLPYGHLSSNLGSWFDTDEDMKVSPKAKPFTTETSAQFDDDQIISYEAVDPVSDRTLSHRFLSSREEGDSSRDEGGHPGGLQDARRTSQHTLLKSASSQAKKQLSQTLILRHAEATPKDLEALQKKLGETAAELHRVKQALYRPALDKATSTYDEEDQLHRCNELNELRKECLRYERQNNELRCELQLSGQDLVESERTNQLLNHQLSQVRQQAETYEGNMKECIGQLAEMLGTDTLVLDESDDLHHLSNILSSKVEIAKSRLSRMHTSYKLAKSEEKRLQADNDKYRRLMKSFATEYAETTSRLKQQVRSSELKAIRLERLIAKDKGDCAVKPSKASASIRIPSHNELESFIGTIIEANERPRSLKHLQTDTAEAGSPYSVGSSRKDNTCSQSVSLNDSTREHSRHSKLISFIDELESKSHLKSENTSPNRLKSQAKAAKGTLIGKGVMQQFTRLKPTLKPSLRRTKK